MSGLKVAIIGTGRLGTLVAGRIPANCRKVIISRRKGGAVHLADEVGGLAADQLTAVRGCQVVFLAVPGSAAIQVAQEVASFLDEGALLVNMATDVLTDEMAENVRRVRVAAAKIIGDAREMSLGSPGVVVVDHVDAGEEDRLRYLLAGLGSVIRDRETNVQAAHAAVAEVMTRAAADLRNRLGALGLTGDLARAAITTAGPGMLRAVFGEAAPAMQASAEKYRSAAPSASH